MSAKTTNEKKELFTVNGFTVREDSTYVIKNKPDMSAPSGFLKEATTKLPSDDVSDSFQCRYIRRANSKIGVWDTGFYPYSPCYQGMDEADVKTKITALKKNLVTPYTQAIGDTEGLSEKNDDSWTKKNFLVYSDLVLSSSDPIDRLTLYFALLTYQITPKGEEGNPIYRDSSYIIVDTTKNLRLKDERAVNKFRATGMFYTLLTNDKAKLMVILKHLELTFSEGTSDETLTGMFDEWLSTGTPAMERIPEFNRVCDKADTEEGYEEMVIYSELKKMFKKAGSKLKKETGGGFSYGDAEIGADLKTAAENIAKKSEYLEIKKELILSND